MSRTRILLLLAVFAAVAAGGAASSVALAGEIFGKVSEGAGVVPEGTEVSVKCGEKSYPAVKTDKSGSYHLVTEESGKCTVTVKRGDGSASVQIASYDEPVQCDLVVETKDGKLSVRRK